MWTIYLFSLAISAISMTAATPLVEPRSPIVGGSQAEPGAVPFLVSIRTRRRPFVCGGTLISPTMVITARHCIPDISHHTTWLVGAGSDDRKNPKVFRQVTQFFEHPSETDVIILEFSVPIPESSGITYAKFGPQPVPDEQVTSTGWGKTEHKQSAEPPTHPFQIQARVTKKIDCDKYVKGWNRSRIKNYVFCTTYIRGRGNNLGDSGSPVINSRGELIGIVSGGNKGGNLLQRSMDVNTLLPSISGWILETLSGKTKPTTDEYKYLEKTQATSYSS